MSSSPSHRHMQDFFSGEPVGNPFELFGTAHITALLLILLANVLIVVFRKWISDHVDMPFRYLLVVLLLGDELVWHIWNATTGQWTIQEMLPFHLCSVMIFLCSIMLLTDNVRLYEFAYLIGVAGALQALLTPNIGPYGYPHFRFFQIMLSHAAIVTSAVYMTAVGQLRPTLGGVKRVMIWGNVYLLAVGIINWIVGSNYMFIARKPETASLLDAFPSWPWYILYMEGLGLILVMLFYLPFHRRKRSLEAEVEAEVS